MKMVLVLIAFFLVYSNAQANEPLRSFRFVEPISVKEREGLPPKLEMELEIFCNEEFAKTVRYERVDPKSKKVTIAVGALVYENLLSSCAASTKRVTVDAGKTFSGRAYEVSRIKK